MVITNAYISSVRLRQGNNPEKSNRNIFEFAGYDTRHSCDTPPFRAKKNEGHSQFKIMKKHTHKTLLSILPMLSEYQKLGKTCLPVSYRKKTQYNVRDDQKMQIRLR